MLSLTGYNIMLENLISQKIQMSECYTLSAHDKTGDKRELLLQLSLEEAESAKRLRSIYVKLFDKMPNIKNDIKETDINDLIRWEADSAALFLHLAKNAPVKELMILYKDLAQKATNHGYMLLLIL